ncbi:MAG: transposase [Mariprofundus sp.]|nr:transposase [Mariprofundus sp.]
MARQSYSKEFKARVALDALKGQKTVGEIASEYKIHPNQISQWKKKALEGMAESFARGKSTEVEDLEGERDCRDGRFTPFFPSTPVDGSDWPGS